MKPSPMKPCLMKTAVAILAAALSACVHTGFGSNKNPVQAASANVQLAIEYMKLDKLALSREYIERALKEDPENPNVQATAGMVYERVGEMPKAEHAFSRAARSSVPESAGSWRARSCSSKWREIRPIKRRMSRW